MKTILILGGYGYTGKSLARHLLRETDAHIVIAGRSLEKAKSFAGELNNPRATAVQADAADFNSLTEALRDVNLCLLAAPTAHHAETVVRACLYSRVDYLDVQFSSKKLGALYAAEDKIKKAELCFVTEAGYHPGLPAALVRYAATKLDVLESALTAGYIGMTNIPYTEAVDELMEAFLDYQAQVYKNGAWTKPASWDMRKFDFGEGIGERACYSMFFEELRALPGMYPSLKNLGFYIAGWNWLADMIVTPLIFLGLKLAAKRGIPLRGTFRPLGKLMWWAMGKSPPPHLVALKVEAKGQRNGKPAQVNIRVSHHDGYEITAIPVAAYLLQYLDGTPRPCGVHLMGQAAEPVRLFRDMQRMGAEVIEFPDRPST
jgi:saccharopine dehydrogenase-like NADP-dependent oxidoreductase